MQVITLLINQVDETDNLPSLTINRFVNYVDCVINRNIVAESAKLVQAAIEDAGRSKRSLSDETGIPYPTLNRKLKAQTEFSFTELFAIAEALSVPPWKFTPTLFSKPTELVLEKTAA